MTIQCPHCRKDIALSNAKPGRFYPRCPKCQASFLLVVPESGPAQVSAGDSSRTATGVGSPARRTTAVTSPSATPAIDGDSDWLIGGQETIAPTKPTASRGQTSAAVALDATTAFGDNSHSAKEADEFAQFGSLGVEDSGLPHLRRRAKPTPAEPLKSSDPVATLVAPVAPPGLPGIKLALSAVTSAPDLDPQATADFRPSAQTAADPLASQPGVVDLAAAPADDGQGEVLGGYRLVKELGRGAMGSVYQATQLSLARRVALKVIQPQWARDPIFIARFTREAYAAAQLGHHHVVQIYDLGAEGGTNFFSMEFIDGESLADLVKREGKLEAEAAVSYTLQAARGLAFAHDAGMIHRDVKPANLLLNRQGLVKVADLGLVKTPSTKDDRQALPAALAATADMTGAGAAMGTPAYMAPEQADDAAQVDARADIYSLGCTLYVLLTGRPPFEGASAVEVLSKHKTEPVIRPDALVRRMPKGLTDICLKMVAKNPLDRFASMHDVAAALETVLGVPTGGGFAPRQEHLDALDHYLDEYLAAPTAVVRDWLGVGFLGVCVLLLAVGIGLHIGWLIGGAAALGLLTPLCYFLLSGWLTGSYLFQKTREYLCAASWSDWGTALVGAFVAVVLIGCLGQGAIWGLAGLCAGGLAAAGYYLVDRRLAAERAAPLQQLQKMLKTLRLRGLDEESLRRFIAKNGGVRWEEAFEDLFGYPAKLEARANLRTADPFVHRSEFAAWREPLVAWMDQRLADARAERETEHLQEVEARGLAAKGMDPDAARAEALRAAEALVRQAAQLRDDMLRQAAESDPEQARSVQRSRVRAMLAASRSGLEAEQPKTLADRVLLPLVEGLIGARMRFLLGCILVALCALWIEQNGLASGVLPETFEQEVAAAPDAWSAWLLRGQWLLTRETKPLVLPILASEVPLLSGLNCGVAGLLLIASSFVSGSLIAVFAFLGAAVAVTGHQLGLPLPETLDRPEVVSLAVGVIFFTFGLFFSGEPEDAEAAG